MILIENVVKYFKNMKKSLIIFLVLLILAGGIYYFFFLKNNEPVVQKNIMGLNIEVLKEGKGQSIENGEKATVHYYGKLENGTKFDSSYDRNTPFQFVVGSGQVIKGWDQGVLGMRVGEKRKLTISPELGYGNREIPEVIPANSTLIFEVELLKIN